MYLEHLWLTDFRNLKSAELSFPSTGLTIVVGNNGQGKTNLIEAVGYAATFRSFRGATPESLVGWGAERAIVRGEATRSQRRLLIENEIASGGRTRSLVNRQTLKRSRSSAEETLMATVFAPDDLRLVKDGPAERRRYIDELLVDNDPRTDSLLRDLDRVLRQRNTLLRQSGGRASSEIATTLDVWDSKFAELGEIIGEARQRLVTELQPLTTQSYQRLSGHTRSGGVVGMTVRTDWRVHDGGKGLLETLSANRSSDLARGVTTSGPHRDEISLSIDGMPARTHASQGEQRTLALSLRMAGHDLLTKVAGAPPILLLDDVFSELDEYRSNALLETIPDGQILLTTATDIPGAAKPTATIRVVDGVAS